MYSVCAGKLRGTRLLHSSNPVVSGRQLEDHSPGKRPFHSGRQGTKIQFKRGLCTRASRSSVPDPTASCDNAFFGPVNRKARFGSCGGESEQISLQARRRQEKDSCGYFRRETIRSSTVEVDTPYRRAKREEKKFLSAQSVAFLNGVYP